MNDLKYAVRALLKSPVFAAIAVVTLALGIGLNIGMFSMLNSMFLQPLPFEKQEALVRVLRATPGNPDGDISAADYADLRSGETEFGEFAGSWDEAVSLALKGRTTMLEQALRVSTNYFDVLRVRPESGRGFNPGDDVTGTPRVAMISDALWKSQFDAAPDIVGRTVRVNGDEIEIIGIIPAYANDGRLIRDIGLFLPLGMTPAQKASRDYPWLRVIGRRKETVSDAQAQAFVSAVASRAALVDPKDDGNASWRSRPLGGATGSQSARIIVGMLLGLSGCVLLIACSNLANFILARTIERAQELSVRSALGASLYHLIRPLAIESLMLAGAGGAGALIVNSWCTRWLSAQALASGGSSIDFPVDWRVLTAAIGISILTALVFGTAPALLIAKINVNETLKSGMRTATTGIRHKKMRSLLVVGQFAMAMTLLAGAAFLLRGASVLVKQHVGWDSENIVVGAVDLPKTRFVTTEKVLLFQRELTARLRAIPGVDSVAIAYSLPYNGGVGGRQYLVEGQPAPGKGLEPVADYNGISPDFFRATGGRLLEGRAFAETDNAAAPKVVIINETMARSLFPGGDAIGHRIRRADLDTPVWCTIVGIVSDSRPVTLYQHPNPFQVYHPIPQDPWRYSMFAVRAEPGALKAVLAAVGPAVASVDADIPVTNLMTADALREKSSFDLGMLEKILVTFAVLGLLLAALGIYGVIARTVVQRTPEIGIRMALGASVANVKKLVLVSGLRLALVGSALGLIGGVAVTKLLASMMPAIDGTPILVIAESAVILAAVAMAACYLPARAAAKVDPVIAIRRD